MASFLVVAWDAAGGLAPVLGVARELVGRGHDVRLLTSRAVDRRCGNAGWRFIPYEETPEYDGVAVSDVATEMSRVMNDLFSNPAVGRDVLAELAREPADAIVCDCLLVTAISAAIGTGTPTVALFHLPYSALASGGATALTRVNQLRSTAGRPAASTFADVYRECAASIVALPREFEDDPAGAIGVTWVGPAVHAPVLTTAVDPIPDVDGASFTLVSLGTGYQAQEHVLQVLLDVLGELGVPTVVTTGPAIDPASLLPPASVTVVRYIPHELLLGRADLVVTHAGLGTVMAALRYGLPMLCLPLGRDQHQNAQRVVAMGVGRTLPAGADPTLLRSAIEALLDPDAPERMAARQMSAMFEQYRGVDHAADILEAIAL